MLWRPAPTGAHDYLKYSPRPGNVGFLHMPDTIVFVINSKTTPLSTPVTTPRFVPTYQLINPTALDMTQLYDGIDERLQ